MGTRMEETTKQDLDLNTPYQDGTMKTDVTTGTMLEETAQQDFALKAPRMQMGEHIAKTLTQGIFVKTLKQDNDTNTPAALHTVKVNKMSKTSWDKPNRFNVQRSQAKTEGTCKTKGTGKTKGTATTKAVRITKTQAEGTGKTKGTSKTQYEGTGKAGGNAKTNCSLECAVDKQTTP